jgi:hypothetical protein
MKKFFLALILALLLGAGPVGADPIALTRKEHFLLGFSPQGQELSGICYHYSLMRLCFITLEPAEGYPAYIVTDSQWNSGRGQSLRAFPGSESGEDPEDFDKAAPFKPQPIYLTQGNDNFLSWYASPDGQKIIVHEISDDYLTGEGRISKRTFSWDNKAKNYAPGETEAQTLSQMLIKDIRESMESGNPGKTLSLLSDIADISGSDQTLFFYPPEDLILPLWHFFRFQGGGEHLADFITGSIFGFDQKGEASLSGFLSYSASKKGVKEHMAAAASLLEKQGQPELAASVRKAADK